MAFALTETDRRYKLPSVLLFAQSGIVQLLLCGEETDNIVFHLVENPHSRYSVTLFWGHRFQSQNAGSVPFQHLIPPLTTTLGSASSVTTTREAPSITVAQSWKLSFLLPTEYLSTYPSLGYVICKIIVSDVVLKSPGFLG